MNWLVDTHVHLDDERYGVDRDAVLQRSISAGVKVLVSIGTRLSDSQWAVEFAEKHSNIYATVGLHPQYAEEWKEADESAFRALAAKEKVAAIGEVGLDYHHSIPDRGQQAEVFTKMIRLSKDVKKPLVIHQREAAEDTLALLRQEKVDQGGIFHCYAGDLATAQAAMELGFYIAVGGILTFPNAENLRQVIRQVPLERLVLETDGPWLAPQAFRGQRNEPAYLTQVAGKLAELKGVSTEEIAAMTSANAFKAFHLPMPSF